MHLYEVLKRYYIMSLHYNYIINNMKTLKKRTILCCKFIDISKHY